jgi:hypothetical protein
MARACLVDTRLGVTPAGGAVVCLLLRGVGATSSASSVLARVERLEDLATLRGGSGMSSSSSSSSSAVAEFCDGMFSMPRLVRLTRELAARKRRACGRTSSLKISTSCVFLDEAG